MGAAKRDHRRVSPDGQQQHQTIGNRREGRLRLPWRRPLMRRAEPIARVRVRRRLPGACVRLRHCGGGQLAVADLHGQLGDRRDLGYLKRRSARDPGLGLGRVLIAEVRE
jgi:hypothetical protein